MGKNCFSQTNQHSYRTPKGNRRNTLYLELQLHAERRPLSQMMMGKKASQSLVDKCWKINLQSVW
jgi:hypothetical protein